MAIAASPSPDAKSPPYKGDTCNIGLVAHRPDSCRISRLVVMEDAGAGWFEHRFLEPEGARQRYFLPGTAAMN